MCDAWDLSAYRWLGGVSCPRAGGPGMDRPTVAIVAAGEMGAAMGARLTEHGVAVRTSLAGRSAATAERAARAGFTIVADDAELADVDYVLSVLPRGEAMAVAER